MKHIATLAALCAAIACFAQETTNFSLFVQGNVPFRVETVPAEVQAGVMTWLPKEKHDRSYCLSLPKRKELVKGEWRAVSFRVNPEADGMISLNVRGPYKLRKTDAGQRLWTQMWVDYRKFEAPGLKNGMLTEADENDPSVPAGWKYSASYRQPEAVWDYENHTLSAWHEGSAVTSIPVAKGKTITVKFEVRGGKIVPPAEN